MHRRCAKVTAIPQMKPGSPGAEQRLSYRGQNTHEDTFIIECHYVPRPPWSSGILEKSVREISKWVDFGCLEATCFFSYSMETFPSHRSNTLRPFVLWLFEV